MALGHRLAPNTVFVCGFNIKNHNFKHETDEIMEYFEAVI